MASIRLFLVSPHISAIAVASEPKSCCFSRIRRPKLNPLGSFYPTFAAFRPLNAVLSQRDLRAEEQEEEEESEEDDLMVHFLTRECGLSCSQLQNLRNKHPNLFKARSIQRAEETLELLRDYGFADTQIKLLVLQNPNVLRNKADKTLRPKLDLIRSLGFEDQELGNAVSRGPRLLNVKELARNIDYFEAVFQGRENLRKAFKKDPTILSCDPFKAERQLELLRKSGFNEEDIFRLISRTPLVLLRSADKIEKVMEYLIQIAGLTPADVVKYPMILGFSLEKRIRPRHEVYRFLASKGIEEGLPPLERLLVMSERNFVRLYVIEQPFRPQLLEIYGGRASSPVSCRDSS